MRQYFEDVERLANSIGGVFSGADALEEISSVNHQLSQDGSGFTYRVNCESCGRPVNVSVTWIEFIYGANRRIPVDPRTRAPWYYDQNNGLLCPNVGCSGCRNPIRIGFNADECQKRLSDGIQAHRVDPRMIQQVESQLQRQR